MALAGSHRQPHLPLVGREREREALSTSLAAAKVGIGQLVLLAGEPGIGKTRLASEIAAEAETERLSAYWGHCFEWAGTPAYWPWIEILRDLIETMEPAALREYLGANGPLVAQIVPEIGQKLPDLDDPRAMNPEQARFRVFDGVTRLLMQAAREHPCVIVLEDLHWADPASLLLLEFLSHEVSDAPLLVLGTYRDVEVRRDRPLASTLGTLVRGRTTQRLSLSRLEREHVGELIKRIAGLVPSKSAIDAVYAETEGNPFFAIEVTRLLHTQGYFEKSNPDRLSEITIPESVREVIGRGLDRLSEQCNELLRVAAVVGREFELSMLQTVSELPIDDVLGSLDEAIEARLVEERGRPGRFQFAHTLIQEALYEEVPVSRRYRLHGKAGETLEQEHGNTLAPHYGDLARHFRLSPLGANLEKAIDYALRAGDQAMEQVAWESAAGHYGRAVELLETRADRDRQRLCEVLLKLGNARERAGVGRGQATGAGNDPAARETFERAALLAREAGLTHLFAWSALGFAGFSLHHTTNSVRQVILMREALAALPGEDSEIQARLLARLSRDLHHWSMADARLIENNDLSSDDLSAQAMQYSDSAIAMARRLDDQPALVYALLARPRIFSDPLESWFAAELAIINEMITTSRELNDPILEAWSWFERCAVMIQRGDVERVRLYVDQFAGIVEPLKMPILEWFVTFLRSADAICTGQYDEAEALIEHGHRTWPNSMTLNCQEVMLRRELGQPIGGVGEFFRNNIRLDDPTWPAFFPFVMVSQLEEGNAQEARAAIREIDLDVVLELPRTPTWVRSTTLYAEMGARFEESDWSRHLYEALLPFADLNISEGFHDHTGGCVAYYLGQLATTLERWDDAGEHFTLALTNNVRWGYRPYVAYTKYAWADMLLRRGDPGDRDQAQKMLADANTSAREIGMVRLLRLIGDLEQREGLKSRPERTEKGELSPRETEVLRLLVDGKSDREIGEALFISHHTVMRHVSSILRKLNVDSRGSAAVYAVRNDLV